MTVHTFHDCSHSGYLPPPPRKGIFQGLNAYFSRVRLPCKCATSAHPYPCKTPVICLWSLHHPMTRKHLPRRTIERCRGEPCIDRGVLDIGMSQPIFHKRQISASIEEVCCDGVLQAMELPFLFRQACDLAIRLHEMVEH